MPAARPLATGRVTHELADGVDRALAQLARPDIDARQPRCRRECDECRCAEALRAWTSGTSLRPARRLSGLRASRRPARRAARLRRPHARLTPGTEMTSVANRLPKVMVPVLSSSRVSTSPAASTARPDMASTLNLHQPVHAGDADGRQQPADGGRNERDEQCHQHGDGNIGPRRRREPARSPPRSGRRWSCRRAGCLARSRWESSAVRRPPPARSCDRGRTTRAPTLCAPRSSLR